jgi:phytoene dehydrogenase-like protein
MKKSIIIVGAGIAGLSAGCYGQMNGYDTEIFELHDLPGGLCTAWERKGYIIDGCIHYLLGSADGMPFNQVWRELGALQDRRIINHESFMRIVGSDGRDFTVYADPDRLEAHMLDLSPRDAGEISAFCDGIRDFKDFDMALLQQKPRSLMGPSDWLEFNKKVLPFALPLARWGTLSARAFAERFEDPLLRRGVAHMFGWEQIPVMAGMSVLAYMALGNAGFPAGASLAFARAVEKRYLELGGTIHYNAQVDKILVEDDRAVGVRLYNDEVHHADIVISAVDGRGTIFHLLDGQYASRRQRSHYDGSLPIRSQVQVSLGVDFDLSNEHQWTTYLLDEPLLIAGEERDELGVKHYCFDPSLAPPGKSVVIVMLESDYDWWQRIYGRRLYDLEQLQVADIIIDFLEQQHPGFCERLEVKDVATPVSYERYTGNWQGATTGWLMTTKTMPMMVQGVSKTLPGLDNFYMAGQWVEPGGMVPVVAMSGRNVIQLICAEDDREFVTSEPEVEAAAV